MKRAIQCVIGVLYVLFLASGVKATTITIDFDSAIPGTLLSEDYTEDGFRMELLSGHYDIWPSGGTNNSQYLGLDEAGEISVVEFTGGTFDLLSLDVLSDSTDFESQTIRSSVGGFMSLDILGVQDFIGPEWDSLAWIRISSTVPIGGPGFDTITFNTVPEPSTALLLALGLIGLAGLKRKLKFK